MPDNSIANYQVTRNERVAATLVALIGTPWAGVQLWVMSYEIDHTAIALLLSVLIFGPGFLVYLGLWRKAFGWRVWQDPTGTWVGVMCINTIWLALTAPGTLSAIRGESEPRDTMLALALLASVVASILIGAYGWSVARRATTK